MMKKIHISFYGKNQLFLRADQRDFSLLNEWIWKFFLKSYKTMLSLQCTDLILFLITTILRLKELYFHGKFRFSIVDKNFINTKILNGLAHNRE